MKEAEDYVIKVALKNREEIESQEVLEGRYVIRLAFWSQFLKEASKRDPACSNISPSKDAWIGLGIGVGGVGLNVVVTRSYARTEIYINRGSKAENKRYFDGLLAHKEEIEKEFGDPLVWERMDDKVTARIKWQLDCVSVFEESDYQKMNAFLIDGIERMRKAFSGVVKKL